MSRSRRASKPVRVTLAKELGGEIDGAWWPHSSQIAAELPELVGALHKPLGEIVDIRINWTASEGQMDLESIATGARLVRADDRYRRPRLMVVVGKTGRAKLLVVPNMTSQALGAMVHAHRRRTAHLGRHPRRPALRNGSGRDAPGGSRKCEVVQHHQFVRIVVSLNRKVFR